LNSVFNIHATAYAISHRFLALEALVRSKVICEICGEPSGMGQAFLGVLWVYPVNIISNTAPFSSSSTCYSYQKTKGRSLGTFQKKPFENRETLDRKVYLLFSLLKRLKFYSLLPSPWQLNSVGIKLAPALYKSYGLQSEERIRCTVRDPQLQKERKRYIYGYKKERDRARGGRLYKCLF
jgi:hypothetical protein